MEPWSDDHPFSALATLPVEEIAERLNLACVRGANDTGTTGDAERHEPVANVLAAAGRRMPDLAALTTFVDAAPLLSLGSDEPDGADACRQFLRTLRDRADGCLRLSVRALELHARDVGYVYDCWLDEAVLLASALGVSAESYGRDDVSARRSVRRANAELLHALAVLGVDRMAVPGCLSQAIGHLLATNVVACNLLEEV